MSMGSMSALPELDTWPTFYWAVVGSAIGVATVVNIYNHLLYRQRLSAAREGTQTPAKPQSWLTLWNATLYAFTREASNFSIHIPLKNRIFRLPTVGRTALIVLNVVVLIVLCLYGLELNSVFTREDVGFRCGVITISQLPLIFLLSGKNNIIGYLSGISYERLNWLHRWCARCMLLTATMHMGYFISAWAPFDYVGYQLKNNAIVWKGLAAWCTLVWIVFSSMTPIRGWCYELFVIQHIISFALFLAFVYIHTPIEMHVYVWIPVALFAFDRIFRLLRLAYANMSIFHPSLKTQGQSKGFQTCQAEFTPLPHDTTRVVVRSPPITWSPGQHVFLSCQSVAPLQNHPFTIASIPEDGRMEFFIKAKKGGTSRFLKYAEKKIGGPDQSTRRTVTIEGPYGCVRPLRQFDSVVLLAGSTGATYTVPLLRDLLQGWKENSSGSLDKKGGFFRALAGAATRHVRFVWVVKSRNQLGWFSEQLSSVYADFRTLQERRRDIKLELTVYITCDPSFTDEHKSLLSSMTTANPDSAPRESSEHGIVQYRGSAKSIDLQEKINEDKEDIRELTAIDSNDAITQQNTCGPNRTCCCRTTIDESTPADSKAPCCCSNPKGSRDTSRPASHTSSTPLSSAKQSLLVHPLIRVYSGRPKTRDIIRRSLEQAMGESAVVVCGPSSLVADVKLDVCLLSDERAVHKGTGAQGIYLHTESYSY
ncbi:ferric-chelate reductase [Plenodomus tracheiphilus IPT5]|uniref:ferric-chelate reductase (NADPH) n=1 Tax=Plenodomus tracheiphilus IPT5 TaxID=1408161 RepID=A0A6A7B372_9PLEO|nr:ferric-chelate reductase [Plenodomus tracheiphilus IPT5]